MTHRKKMQLVCQNNSITKINNRNNNNNKIYPVTYKDDGINKTATYHSILDEPGVKGEARLTLHQTKHSKGYHFESRTQFAEKNQSTIEENGEERCQRLELPKRLPEITMGAFYIEEIEDDDNLSEENGNNNFLIDPDTIDLTKEDINLEALGMKKINDETQWNDLVEEFSQRYVTTIREEPPKIKIVSVRGGNGEKQAGETCYPDDGMFAAMPGGKNHVTTDAVGQPSILRALLVRASRDDIHSRKKNEEELNLKDKNTLERINIQKKKADILHNAVWRETLKKSIKENNPQQEIKKNNKSNQERDCNAAALRKASAEHPP